MGATFGVLQEETATKPPELIDSNDESDEDKIAEMKAHKSPKARGPPSRATAMAMDSLFEKTFRR